MSRARARARLAMAGFPKLAWQGGSIVPFADARVSVADRGLLFGESVYEVLPVTAGRVRWQGPHFARMREGAAAIGIEAPMWLGDDAGWPAALVGAEGIDEGLLYLQLTGGAAPRAHLAHATPELFAFVMPHAFPDAARRARGLFARCIPELRWHRRDLKTTMLLPSILGKRAAAADGADEVLWLDAADHVLEGGSSNVAIVEHGVVVTPPPGRERLPGITLAQLETIAASLGVTLRHEVLPRTRMLAADEVFVLATSQLVMPVLRIDGTAIADGTAGPITLRLADALAHAMASA